MENMSYYFEGLISCLFSFFILHDISASNLRSHNFCTRRSNGDNIYIKCKQAQFNGTHQSPILEYLDEKFPDVILDIRQKILSVDIKFENFNDVHILYIQQAIDSTNSHILHHLLKPIVLKAKLNEPRQTYHLKWINYVNGKPTEEVINKENRKLYFGCDSREKYSTCGTLLYGLNDPIPFSEGFCCSCLDTINIIRQPNQDIQVGLKETQPRGGQNCRNISVGPGYANPQTYHESSHCFRYSDLWFNVYKIEKPHGNIPIVFQLYKKNKLGKFIPTKEKETQNSINFLYGKTKGLNKRVPENLNDLLVLIPQNLPKVFQNDLPRLDPNKLLAIESNKISIGGLECNKIGVGQQAFFQQESRCYKNRGSCLYHQPIDLWLKSEYDQKYGRLGQNFIESYLGSEIKFDMSRMTIDHYAFQEKQNFSVQGIVKVKIKKDNSMITDKIQFQINEVAVSTVSDLMKIKLSLTNLGLVSNEVLINLIYWDENVRNSTVLVHSQQTAEFVFQPKSYPNEYTSGFVELLDENKNKIASRMFIASPNGRCYCLWHWKCVCYNGDEANTIFKPKSSTTLDQKEYAEAGFQGDVPTNIVSEMADENYQIFMKSVVLFCFYIAISIYLGILKAISPFKSYWLWIIFSNGIEPLELCEYREEILEFMEVVKDHDGYYIHPVTKSRNIRVYDKKNEFFQNIALVCFWPMWIFLYQFKKPNRTQIRFK